jgi:hypothetical protein
VGNLARKLGTLRELWDLDVGNFPHRIVMVGRTVHHFCFLEEGMERIRLVVQDDEYVALARMAEQDLRPLAGQAHHLVREGLRQAGLLDSMNNMATDLPVARSSNNAPR